MHTIKIPTFIIFLICALQGCSHLNEEHAISPSVYLPSIDPMLDIQIALNQAKAENKHLLVVMGAQWCHDSTGLATQFNKAPLSNLLDDEYVVRYVDVGYFNDLRPISQRFGQAHYFATPSVMIIEPQSEQLLNADTMNIWGRADSVSFEKYMDYFTQYAKLKNTPQYNVSSEQLGQIKAFETIQAQRLMQAYQHLIPDMMIEDKKGKVSDEFYAHWGEVREYRTALQLDILELYKQAQNNSNEKLMLPNYATFSWEILD